MNKIVAVTTATAIPVASPSIAGSITDDRAGITARAQEVVDLLRTRYICHGWKMDEVAAVRAIEFCRQYEADGSEPDEERKAALDFFHRHGQSLDWILLGDHRSMICTLAARSHQATNGADAELLKLGRQFDGIVEKVIAAHAEYSLADGPYRALVDERATWPAEHKKWTREDAGQYHAVVGDIEQNTDAGRRWAEASDGIDAAIDASDGASRAIQSLPPTSLAGLAVTAKAAALACAHYWPEPLDESDWDKRASRVLIENVFRLAGLPPVEEYLGEII